jgi:hypothetical protein
MLKLGEKKEAAVDVTRLFLFVGEPPDLHPVHADRERENKPFYFLLPFLGLLFFLLFFAFCFCLRLSASASRFSRPFRIFLSEPPISLRSLALLLSSLAMPFAFSLLAFILALHF